MLLVKFWNFFRWVMEKSYLFWLFLSNPLNAVWCVWWNIFRYWKIIREYNNRDVKRRMKWLKTSQFLKHSEVIISECWLVASVVEFCVWLPVLTYFLPGYHLQGGVKIGTSEVFPRCSLYLTRFGDSYHLTFLIHWKNWMAIVYFWWFLSF